MKTRYIAATLLLACLLSSNFLFGQTSVCIGDVTTVFLSRNIGCSFGAGFDITWDGPVGGNLDPQSSGSSTVNVTWTSTGTFRLKRNFPAGCTGTPLYSTYYTVLAKPAIPSVSEVNQQPGSCGQVILNYTGASSGFWQNNSVETYETYNTTRTVTATGDYYLRIKNANGCWSDARTLTVSSLPPSPIGGTLAGGGAWYGSVNTNLSLSGQSGSIKEYRYTENGGGAVVVAGTSTPLPISISNPSSSTVTRQYWAIVQLNGCEISSSVTTVTINPVPTPNASISINISSCASTVVTQTNPLSGAEQYEWWWQTSSGGTSTALGSAASVTITSAGSLYLRARTKSSPYVWSPGFQSLGNIQVYTMPSAPTSGTNASGFYNNSVTLSVGAVTNATSYRWYDAQSGGTFITTTATNSYNIPNLLSTSPLFVATVSGGCETPGRFPVTATLVVPQIVLQSESPNVIFGKPVILGIDGVYDSYVWKDKNGITKGTQSTFSTTQPDKYTITVTKSGMTGAGVSSEFNISIGPNGQNRNFIVSNSISVKGVTASASVDFLNAESNSQVIQYFDGLGRPIQSVTTQGSPNKKDIVQPIVYDTLGREYRKYLPVVPGSSDGWFKTINYDASGNYAGAAGNFYNNNPNGKVAQDNRPFSETVFEPSPLSRPVKSYGPGQAWNTTGNNKFIAQQYLFNVHGTTASATTEKIIAWKTDPSTGMPVRQLAATGYIETSGHFSTGQLSITQSIDEQGNAVREYTNKSGQVILKKVQATSAGSINLNDLTGATPGWALTYYIYDDLGNLRYVFPPELSKLIHESADTYAVTSTNLTNWAFQYKYDIRKRMIEKQVPGASIVYMVYDNLDRLVLTQDGNQRPQSQWLFTKYDVLNRPVATGMYTSAPTIDQDSMQVIVNNFYSTLDATKAWYETFTGNFADVHGYDNKSFPKESNTDNYLTVMYYDNYNFLTSYGSSFDYHSGLLKGQEINYFPRATGQATGAKTKIIGDVTWLKSVNYYDSKYRVLQTVMENNQGGYDISSNVYDFGGKVLRTATSRFKRQPINWTSIVNCTLNAETLTSTTTTSWGAGAVSSQLLPAGVDGWAEFKVANTPTNPAVGLSRQNTSNNLNTIDYAIYIVNGASLIIKAYENGTLKTNIGNVVVGDVLRVERAAGKIFFKKNGVVIYVSATPSTQPLMADVGFSQQNASIGATKLSHTFSGFTQEPITTYRSFVYDHAGRLLETWHKVGQADSVLIAQNEYNEVGQLVTKKVHSTEGETFKQQVDYRYNIRGWLTRINDANVNTVNDGGPRDLFGMNLLYNEVDSNLGNTGLFNGNISAMKWSGNMGLADVSQRGYSFSYDAMNRLKSASHHEKGISNWSDASGFHENNLNYDLNGNIQTLNRKGVGGSNMDELTYTYGGSNRLISVADAGDKTMGFKEITSTGTDYEYDANGNMVWDRNKGGEEVTTNGSFENGNSGWTITEIGSRFTFTNNEVQVVAGPGSTGSVLAQSVLEKGKAYVIVVEMERTAGTLTVTVGSTGAAFLRSFTSSGTHVFSITAGTTTNDLRIALNTPFVGKIKSVSVKAITVITYNHLNLPDLVTRAESQLQYVYDATGRKLSQVVSENGVTSKQTNYEGEFIYQNDTLQFINHEEGRVVMKGASPEYQYNLKDHLGNVRLTFTTKREVDSYTAGLETVNASIEDAEFSPSYDNAVIINSTLYNHTPGGSKSQRLSAANQNEIIGLSKSFKVMPGDTLDLEVQAKYTAPTATNTNVNGLILAAMTSAFGVSSASTGEAGILYQSLNNLNSIGALVNSGEGVNEGAPKAYLNYILFDDQFNPYDFGFKQITTAALETGSGINHETLQLQAVARQAGFAYIYLSNESNKITDVYFDDLKIEHTKSPVIQMDDYYPFGLTFNSYSRENSVANNYLYNGKELQDELNLGWYDYQARQYDPAIARWMSPDPLSEVSRRWSPYVYCYNNPIIFIDPDGMLADFYNEDGHYLGSDGVDDGRVYQTTDQAWGSYVNNESCESLPSAESSEPNYEGLKNDSDSHFLGEKNEFGLIQLTGMGNAHIANYGNEDSYSYTDKEGNTVANGQHGDDWVTPSVGAAYNAAVNEFAAQAGNENIVVNVNDASAFNPAKDLGHLTHFSGESIDSPFIKADGSSSNNVSSLTQADKTKSGDFVKLLKNKGFTKNYSDNGAIPNTVHSAGHTDHFHVGK